MADEKGQFTLVEDNVTSVASNRTLKALRAKPGCILDVRCALTIFRLEPGPYESAHQLDCSFLLPTATADGTGR